MGKIVKCKCFTVQHSLSV